MGNKYLHSYIQAKAFLAFILTEQENVRNTRPWSHAWWIVSVHSGRHMTEGNIACQDPALKLCGLKADWNLKMLPNHFASSSFWFKKTHILKWHTLSVGKNRHTLKPPQVFQIFRPFQRLFWKRIRWKSWTTCLGSSTAVLVPTQMYEKGRRQFESLNSNLAKASPCLPQPISALQGQDRFLMQIFSWLFPINWLLLLLTILC